jgi:hypothetical protein
MQTYELTSPHPGKKPLPYAKIGTKFVKDIDKSSEELILGMWQYEEDQRLKDPTVPFVTATDLMSVKKGI